MKAEPSLGRDLTPKEWKLGGVGVQCGPSCIRGAADAEPGADDLSEMLVLFADGYGHQSGTTVTIEGFSGTLYRLCWGSSTQEIPHNVPHFCRCQSSALGERRSVPPTLGNTDHPSVALEDAPRHRTRLQAGQPGDKGRDVFRRHCVKAFARLSHGRSEYLLGHPGPGAGRERIDGDPVAPQLYRGDQ